MNKKISKFLLNKKSQSEVLALILSFVILSSSVLIVTNTSLNSTITTNAILSGTNTIEKIIEIEVWADSYIELEISGKSIVTNLYLDNGTLLEKELELHLNNELTQTNNGIFNLTNTSPGTYFLTVVFQGTPSQFINPSSIEKQIEVTDEEIVEIIVSDEINETEIILENETVTNQTLTNETDEIINFNLALLQGKTCGEFSENVLWSSGYPLNEEGSTKYYSWKANNTCSNINKTNCVLKNLEVETRFIYLNLEDKNELKNNYIQIAQLNKSICDNPEFGNYTKHLAFESFSKDDVKKKRYCDKNPNADCESGTTSVYGENDNCYGIKAYSSQYSIVDVFEVKYDLCWEEGENGI